MDTLNWFFTLVFIFWVVIPILKKSIRKLFDKTEYRFTVIAIYLCALWFLFVIHPM